MNETELLREELSHYRSEKERLRKVIHQVGGKDDRPGKRWINMVFLVLMLGLFGVSSLHQLHLVEIPGLPAMLLLDVAVLLVSLKLVLMISSQDRSADFQFWLLNSIDYRIHTLGVRLGEMEKKLEDRAPKGA